MLKRKSNKSIIRDFFFYMIAISFISTAIIGYLWISNEFHRFKGESEKMRKDYFDSQKAVVKYETEKTFSYIDYVRSSMDIRLKQMLKNNVYEAHRVASTIYERYRGKKSETEIKQVIKDVLGIIRFNEGRGFYYFYSMDGTLELYPVKPQLEGKNQLDLKDKRGIYVVRREIELVKKMGEGFLVDMDRDLSGDNSYPSKVSFVKYFKPLNGYIGSREYREDYDRDIQKNVLDRLVKIKFGNSGYVFVVDYEGRTLANEDRKDLIGKKVWEMGSPDGAAIIQKARKAVEPPEGDFLQYSWHKLGQKKMEPKISFLKAEPKWKWIVGAGVFLDDIDRMIANERAELKKFVTGQIINIIGLFLGIFGLVLFITFIYSKRLKNQFNVFLTFFKDAVASNEKIDQNKLHAVEFKEMAESANRMIDDRQKMEAELQKAQKLESLGLLAGGIAHDFNNLMTGILGNVNLAKAYLNPRDNVFKLLLMAEKAAIKTKRLTQQLLTFARGGAPIKNVHAVVELIEEAVLFSLRGSNVKCEFSLPDDLWPVEVDEGQMNQVLNNLIINAIQAMPNGGIIKVSAANVEPMAVPVLPRGDIKYVGIEIKDSGEGIPEDIICKIFDPYFTTKLDGNGLGLTSVYSIIKRHEGCVDVKSIPGEGATFTLYIPASEKEVPVGIPEVVGTEEEQVKGVGRVLMMDDDNMVSEVAVKMLTHLGYKSEVARDGAEAITLYREALESGNPFDIVIMDLTIPGGMGGAEAIRKLLEIDPGVKAVVSSGYSNDPVMSDYTNYGFKGCIVKPYKVFELGEVIRQVLN